MWPEYRDAWAELRAAGWSYKRIAARYGVGHATVWAALNPEEHRERDRAYRLRQAQRPVRVHHASGYERARAHAGACPIEAGLVAALADNECTHGRLPNDQTEACGCWPGELAPVATLPGVEPDAITELAA